MKKLMLLLAVALVVCAFVAMQAVAAEQTKPMSSEKQTPQPMASQPKGESAQKGQMNTDRVSQIIGKTVVDSQDKKVGEVEDLLTDNGRISYVILSHGGLLGIGEKYVPIPWNQFASQGGKVRVDSSGDIMVNISKERLEKAPNFAKSDWKDVSSAE
jgi:sporulation protein YlmC with PRC-barrel domain